TRAAAAAGTRNDTATPSDEPSRLTAYTVAVVNTDDAAVLVPFDAADLSASITATRSPARRSAVGDAPGASTAPTTASSSASATLRPISDRARTAPAGIGTAAT